MKAFAERIFPTEQFANIKIHLEDDVKTEESTEQVILRLVANLKSKTVEDAIYAKPASPAPPAQTVKPTPQPKADSDLEYTATPDGKTLLIHPKHHLEIDRFKEVSAKVKTDGGKYVAATVDTPGHWEVPQ